VAGSGTGRPRVPILSRPMILRTALEIVDESGLEALSIRRLATELGVKSASLYNHFPNKDAILAGAAELAFEQAPGFPAEVPARELLVGGACRLRSSLMAHPGLVPVVARRRSMGMSTKMLDTVAGRLARTGIPVETAIMIFNCIESYVVGSVIREIAGEDRLVETDDPEAFPHLAAAGAAPLDADALFVVVIGGIVDSLIATA
jgi:TetR/AcrR family transcriptional regulator, tetracycline repressor protein